MSKTFLKFKERQQRLRLIKSLAIGGAFGIGLGGLCLILAKLDLLGFAPIFSLPIALVIFAAAGALAYRALAQSDIALASELDARFDLKEKVQTMVAFDGEGGDMLALQRDDAECSLSQISPDQLKIEKIWIYITALSAALAILIGGIITPNIWKRNQNPPYKLTEYQEAGIKELINYVNSSEMEEQYRAKISAELTDLLSDLKGVDNEKAMRAELAESMALICAITYDSSNSAEILNTLWGTSDRYLRYLAKWLDTSSSYDEGDFAERLVAGEGAAHNRAFCNYDDHIYGSASPTVIITHKVFENEPRCVLERMDVYTCKVCGWQKFHQLSVTYTFCCPED